MTDDPDRYDHVIAALDRLARGSFARCDICGTQIDDRRLRLAPDAERCARHVNTPLPRHPSAPGARPPAARSDPRPDPAHEADGTEGSVRPGGAAPDARAALLAPFVAWMATRPIDEPTRRGHREVVEAYLDWCDGDDGPVSGRRRRYEDQIGRRYPDALPAIRDGLDRYAEYRAIVARTLPTDPR